MEYLILAAIFLGIMGFKIVRPVERGVVERFGKYVRTSEQGLRWIIPFIDKMYRVNITEIRLDVAKQSVITKDNLNLFIDAVVYFQVKDSMKALYNVNDYMGSIPSLAQTTLRSVVGELPFTEVNANRNVINSKLESELDSQTQSWGIDVLRVELQDVQPSGSVQQAMDQVVTAEREKEAKITKAIADKEATKESAEARIIDARASKQATIERAQGNAESIRLNAIARADALKLINNAAEESFKKNAKAFKSLEVAEISLRDNAKIVLTDKGITPTLVLNESQDRVVPVQK